MRRLLLDANRARIPRITSEPPSKGGRSYCPPFVVLALALGAALTVIGVFVGGLSLTVKNGSDSTTLSLFLSFAILASPAVGLAIYFAGRRCLNVYNDKRFYWEHERVEIITFVAMVIIIICWPLLASGVAANRGWFDAYMTIVRVLAVLLIAAFLLVVVKGATLCVTAINYRLLGAQACAQLERERLFCLCASNNPAGDAESAYARLIAPPPLDVKSLQGYFAMLRFLDEHALRFVWKDIRVPVDSPARARLAAGLVASLLLMDVAPAPKAPPLVPADVEARLAWLHLIPTDRKSRYRRSIPRSRPVVVSTLVERDAVERRFARADDAQAFWAALGAASGTKVAVKAVFAFTLDMVKKHREIAQQGRDIGVILRQVYWCFFAFGAVLLVVFSLAVFNQDIQSSFVVFSALFLGFSFIFKDTIAQAFTNLVWISRESLIVGESVQVAIGNDDDGPTTGYLVQRINLFSSILLRGDGSRVVGWNAVMAQGRIYYDRLREPVVDTEGANEKTTSTIVVNDQ